MEDRYDRSSTVITSQLPTAKWHAALELADHEDPSCGGFSELQVVGAL